MNDLSVEELRQILERCRAATPGPWKSWLEGREKISGSSFIQTAAEDIYLTGATEADQEFIAHARQDVERLVAVVAQLKGWRI